MIIQATKKLQDMLKINLTEKIEDENSFESWSGNVFMLGRRKCLLLTHTQTLYSVFIYGVTQKTFKNLEEEVHKLLQILLKNDGISEELLGTVKNISFVKSSNRSVVSSMNQMSAELQCYKTSKEDELAAAVLLNHSLRTYGKKHDRPARFLSNYNKSSSKIIQHNEFKKTTTSKNAFLGKIECVNDYRNHKSYKKVEVLEETTLLELCADILVMFDFDNDHMHQFYLSKTGAPYNRENIILNGSIDSSDMDFMDPDEQFNFEQTITVKEAIDIEPSRFLCMIFDFGEDWVFKISKYKKEVEFDSKKEYPFIVKTIGDNPIQYPDFDDEYEDDDEDLDNIIDFKKL